MCLHCREQMKRMPALDTPATGTAMHRIMECYQFSSGVSAKEQVAGMLEKEHHCRRCTDDSHTAG